MDDRWEGWTLDEPAAIEAALAAHPLVAERLASRRQLPSKVVPFLQERVAPMEDLFATLDPTGLQLLQLAQFHHGVTRKVALDEARDCPPEAIDRSARNLVVAGLATCRAGVLEVASEVSPYLALQLPLFEDYLDGTTSDRLGLACRLLGVDGGTRKAERAAAVLSVLRDADRLMAAIDAAGPATAELFRRVLELSTDAAALLAADDDEPPGAIPLHRLLPPEERFAAMRYRPSSHPKPNRRPHEELIDRLVVGSRPFGGYSIWLWFDVLYAFTGRVFPSWALPATPAPEPIEASPAAVVRAVTAISGLAEHLGVQPAEGKKSGDQHPPVRVWRAAAKALDIDASSAPFLGELAVDIGLVYGRYLPKQGRGRNTEYPVQWQPNGARVAEFDARSPGERWLVVVDAWLRDVSYGAAGRTSTLRRLTLSFLASLPEGMGLRRGDLDRAAGQRHLALGGTQDLDDILAEMVALGLAPARGPIGLTAAGRAAAQGAPAVDDLIGAGSSTFVIQPDHSVIAPPDLSPTVAAVLHRYADLQGEGGASVWRLSARRLALASSTTSVEAVVDFFQQHSSVAVPDVVVRFISDAMTSTAPITVTAVGCVITASDPVVIAEAARHKAAKLTVMAPAVAVSPLSLAKVTEVLRTKGVVVAGAGATAASASGASPERITEEVMAMVGHRDPKQALGPARPVTLAGPMAARLAGRLAGRRS